MAVVTASSRGQIVIPKDIRRQLEIVPGKKLSIKAEAGRILMTPLPNDPIESFCGIFKEGPSLTKALLKQRKAAKALDAKKTSG